MLFLVINFRPTLNMWSVGAMEYWSKSIISINQGEGSGMPPLRISPRAGMTGV